MDTRKQTILDHAISRYIQTAEPVGSKVLAENSSLQVSPATIRHELNELEKEGYLVQPHTSSGRVPTDKGYRFYVDSLDAQAVGFSYQGEVQTQLRQVGKNVHDVLGHISDIMHSLIDYTTIVLTPDIFQETLKVAHLILVDIDKVLVVLLHATGINSEFLLRIQDRIDQEDLNKISRLITEKLSGQPVFELSDETLQEMVRQIPQVSHVLIALQHELQHLAKAHRSPRNQVHTKGVGKLLKLPEFRNVELTQKVLTSLEESKILAAVLSEYLNSMPSQVVIGQENKIEGLQDCSLVLSPCTVESSPIGLIAVLGPTRMDYSTVVPMVNHLTHMISTYLSEKEY